MAGREIPGGDTWIGKQPSSRLSRLADVARKAIEADPEYCPGDRLFLAVSDEDDAGCFVAGYGSDQEETATALITDLVEHVEAILTVSHGHPVHIVLVPTGHNPN